MTAASIACEFYKVAFTSAMVLLANISRMLKQLPLTARTWGHFQVAKNKPQRRQKRPRGKSSAPPRWAPLFAPWPPALGPPPPCSLATAPEHEWRSATALQGVWKCETHLTFKCGNKEVRCKILTHCETIEKTLQVVDCEKHFALWTGMVWTRSSQDWI